MTNFCWQRRGIEFNLFWIFAKPLVKSLVRVRYYIVKDMIWISRKFMISYRVDFPGIRVPIERGQH